MPPESQDKPPAIRAQGPHLEPEEVSEFEKIISAWAVEVGLPNMRPSWDTLQGKVQKTKIPIDKIWEEMHQCLPSDRAILLILALTPNQPTLRNVFLRQALSNLVRGPVGKALPALLHFSPEEIKANLAPLLYSDGVVSKRAAYLMARMSLTMNANSMPLFLSSHEWDENSLKNLALITDAEKASELDRIFKEHEKETSNSQLSEISRKFLDFFRNRDSINPISPDLSDGIASPPSEPAASGSGTSPGFPREPQKTDEKQQGRVVTEPPILSGTDSPEPGARANLSKQSYHVPPSDDSIWETHESYGENEMPDSWPDSPFGISRKIFWGLIFSSAVVFFLAFSLMGTPDPEKLPAPTRRAEAPSFWVDAVSRKQITQNFLMADNDFQMGELFLMRGKFDNALSLFRDAVSREPKHVAAQFRVGYCLVQLQDYLEAGKALKKTLEMQGDFPNANLFLARICLIQKEWEKALGYYEKEYAIKTEKTVGLEYAHWLHKLGRFPEAIKILSDLEKREPGNLAISSKLAEVKLDSKGLKK